MKNKVLDGILLFVAYVFVVVSIYALFAGDWHYSLLARYFNSEQISNIVVSLWKVLNWIWLIGIGLGIIVLCKTKFRMYKLLACTLVIVGVIFFAFYFFVLSHIG